MAPLGNTKKKKTSTKKGMGEMTRSTSHALHTSRKRARVPLGVLVLAIVMAGLLLLPGWALAETTETKKAPEGYWQLVKGENEPRIETYPHKENDTYTDSYSATELVHMQENLGRWHADGKDGVHTAIFKATCTEPPEIVEGGEKCVFTITLTLEANDSPFYHFGASAEVKRDKSDTELGSSYKGYSQFRATKEGEPYMLSLSSVGEWDRSIQDIPPESATNGAGRTVSVEVADTFPNRNTDYCCVYFRACGGQTVWTYKWVPYDSPEVVTPVTTSSVDSENDTDTSSTSVAENDTTSTSSVQEDPTNIVIHTDASKDSGTSGGWFISAAIVTGAVVVGGALVLLGRNGGKKSRDDGDDDGEEEQPSTFRMYLWKDFGDTLVVNGPKWVVGARIEEEKADGQIVFRDDLTRRIEFLTTDNISAEARGMDGLYNCIDVAAESLGDGVGAVSVKFVGKGGSFTNVVRFKIEEPRIEFADMALTFVAGGHKTYAMPFKISNAPIAEDVKPDFPTPRLTVQQSLDSFCDLRVVPDPDVPDKLYNVELTECGKADDHEPGTMLQYECEVTVVLPAQTQGGKDLTLTGLFTFYRFYEGLRFVIEPLKCYMEPYTEQEEHVINGEWVLEGAAGNMAQAIGASMGTQVPGVYRHVERSLRKAARNMEEMYPHFFSEDQLYVFDTYDAVRVTPGRTNAYLTLFVVDEFQDDEGHAYLRPCTPLPGQDDIMLAFEDVEGSTALHDEKGRIVENPAKALDFDYYIKDVRCSDNTVLLEILPTAGYMLPPNRTEVDVTAFVTWKDRKFMKEQRVNAISQPFRKDYVENADYYDKEDAERRKILEDMQKLIAGKYTGEIAVEGSVSIKQTFADWVGDAIDRPALSLNPLTAPAYGLYSVYESVKRQLANDVYYPNLMPLYHLIQMTLDGYEEHYGFYDPDILRFGYILERYAAGEIGSTEAIDLAMHGRGRELYDAFGMTLREVNRSLALTACRIGMACKTLGASELVFVPLSALSQGIEAGLDYLDHGGESYLEAFRVGADWGSKMALLDVSLNIVAPYAIKGAAKVISMAGKAAKGAFIMTKEAVTHREAIWAGLKKVFSSGKYAGKVANASTKVAKQLSVAIEDGHRVLLMHGEDALSGLDLQLEIAHTLGRYNGAEKVKLLRKAMEGGLTWEGQALSTFEQRCIALRVQCDKHALRVLEDGTDRELKAYFNSVMGSLEQESLDATVKNLSKRLGRPVKFEKPSGNSYFDVLRGNKVPMDMDASFYYKDSVTGEWVYIRSDIAQEAFDAQFYRIARGHAGSKEAMSALARRADMTITDLFHPEAYSTDYDDLLRICEASRAGEAFTAGKSVARVARYKCEHWMQFSREMLEKAKAANAAGKSAEIVEIYLYKAAAFSEESVRQCTKQVDRIILPKLAQMDIKGIAVPPGLDIDRFLAKVSALKQSGAGRFGLGYSTSRVNNVLMKSYKASVDEIYREMETIIVELDKAIKAAKSAKGA